MIDLENNTNRIHDSNNESRIRNDSTETMPSTSSSSSDYMTGEADDSSESKAVVPFSLKSVETVLSLTKVSYNILIGITIICSMSILH